ncbi:hypothetical protein B0J15DRAFT_507005 [Fusarium solani]|uniref:DUF2828 domain-containing protein n=1 Tax=Fusarium solani TaxID=169388 RepID=A0A9P9RE00_FUSSL|nr:uncharacterized protein B0J15DRAFT_507005 [Fusarium solani]KAH7275048.1 hypothetical protein B0J15DRAFT_507005 [Fusarium solani]
MASTTESQEAWFLKSSYPVLFPFHESLKKPQAEFENFLQEELRRRHDETPVDLGAGQDQVMTDAGESEAFTLVSNSTTGEIRKGIDAMDVTEPDSNDGKPEEPKADTKSNPFMEGLVSYGKKEEEPPRNLENMMHTENRDLAYRSTKDALVDLFQELEEVVSGPRLAELLPAAWKADPLDTLSIIFNARSIHLGKSSRVSFYRCAGWLAQNHPATLVANLPWLSRPIIEKKAKKEKEDDAVIVDVKDENDPSKYDVKHGVAHGYWKDLLNILALAANNKLDGLSDPKSVLNSKNPGIIRGKSIAKTRGRGEFRRQTRDNRYEAAVKAFNTDPVYRALHLTIARLFAEQLEKDLRILRGVDAKAKRTISLCGKWAPSHDHFHDRHTFIVSTIAEILYPRDSIQDNRLLPTDDRETYLRFAREEYRKDTSALRKHLEVVERDITLQKFDNIKYDRVPSLAMSQYSKLFIEKDMDHFGTYIDKVAEGKANISGATLLPSTLIQKVRGGNLGSGGNSARDLVDRKVHEIEAKVVDGQWKTLVQRIKDSGTLESCIAVCDVSGSMTYPNFPDNTTPMDSAIGLSLLIAEVAKPPFSGAFITFSARPTVEQVDLAKPLGEKYRSMLSSQWGMNTNFVAVFEDLILPMAIKNNLKQEDMVKRVFVFSDMQFDAACGNESYGWDEEPKKPAEWTTSFERIKSKYQDAGYEMPELVFWNLAGGRAGYSGGWGDTTAPKPVTAEEEGTCLVSGYSQGMLKVFLDGGGFEEPEEEDEDEEVVVDKDEDGNVTEKPTKKKAKMDPLKVVKKAISHKAYDMLKVVD